MTHDARRRPDDHVIVLFGATGDLARRKLLPGLFNLHCAGLMPEHYRVIGVARPGSALSDEEFRQRAHDAVEERGMRKPEGPDWDAFVGNLSFAPADVGDPDALVAAVDEAEQEIGGSHAGSTTWRSRPRRSPASSRCSATRSSTSARG